MRCESHCTKQAMLAVLIAVIAILTVKNTLSMGGDLLGALPWMDQWITSLIYVDKGMLGFEDMFAQHNEHRIPITFLVDIVDMKINGGNGWTQFLITTTSCLIMPVVIWRSTVYGYGVTRAEKATVLFGLVSLFFCVSQIELWSWPFLVGNVLSNAFSVSVLCLLPYAISSESRVLFIIALILSTLAVFGLASGILVWPIGALIILVLERRVTFNLFIWCCASGLISSLYFYGYTRPGHHANPVESFERIGDILVFWVHIMGSAVGGLGNRAVIIMGLSVIFFGILSILWVVRSQAKSAKSEPGSIAMCAIVLFSLLCGVLVSVARLNFGFEYALSSRYTSVSVMALSAMYVLGFSWFRRYGLSYQIGWVFLFMLLFINPPHGLGYYSGVSGTLKVAGISVAMKINDQDIISKVTPLPDKVGEVGLFFERNKISVFHGRRYPVDVYFNELGKKNSGSICSGSVEKVESISTDRSAMRVTGWARMYKSPHTPVGIAFVEKDTGKVIGWAAPGGASAPSEGLMEGTVNPKRYVGYAKTTSIESVRVYAVNPRSGEFCLLE